ncbi:MAG: outer membrane protein assembly factor BamD [Proteobacteria bacterium]|nr:outer membrane protein assembly factor BamD [Pseudomonadota bacterium]
MSRPGSIDPSSPARRGSGARRLSARLAATCVALLVGGSGCLSHQDGAALRRDIDRVQASLQQERDRAGRTREQLRQVIERATGLLTRNSADVGAQVEALQQRLAQLDGSMEQLRKQLDDLQRVFDEIQKRLDSGPKGGAGASAAGEASSPAVPEGADALFALANEKLVAGEATLGRQLLRQFISRFPRDARSAGAQCTLGNGLFAEQKYAAAIQEYRKVVEQYAQSASVAEALYQIGLSFHQLKYCSDAEGFLGELLKHHRASPFAEKANTLLKLIRRYRGDKRICSS